MKTKFGKIALLLFAAVVCVVSLHITAFAAYSEITAVGATVELDGTNTGTVTVSLSATNGFSLLGIQGVWSTTETEGTNYLTLKDIGSDGLTFNGTTNAYDALTGEVIWGDDSFVGASFNKDGNVLTATYEVAANTPEGTYTVTFATTYGADMNFNEFYDTFTATITVTHAAPACDHSTTKLVPNGNGTHKVVCANDECGATIEGKESETCTGTDDGDCTTAVTCDCGYTTTAANAAHTPEADDGDCTTAVKCANCDEIVTAANAAHTPEADDGDCTTAVKCANCDEIATAANAAHTPEADDGDCTTAVKCANCDEIATAANANHTGGEATCTDKAKCTVCGKEYGEKDSDNHSGEVKYTNNGRTHSAAYDCCGIAYVTNEDHDFTDGNCICGAEKPAPVYSGWTEIDGEWYYYIDAQTKATGLTRVPYPTVAIDGVTYAPNAEDLAYYNANKDTSKYSDATTAVFYFDENGVFQNDYTGPVANGSSYAVNGMAPWHVGMVKIGADYYYYSGDKNVGGNVLTTGKVYATRDCGTGLRVGSCVVYIFDGEGKLEKNQGIVDGYFYNNDYTLAIGAGLVQIENDYYYVRSNGVVIVDREYWVVKTNDLEVVAGLYTFDADGKMVDPVEFDGAEDGIVELNGDLYYIKDGKCVVGAGVVELTDAEGETFYIYVKSSGKLATGKYWPTNLNGLLDSGMYNWGADGKYYPAAN